MPENKNILAEAQNLTVKFRSKSGGRVTAVNSVSLELHEGETLAVVGESGSGKTTLLRSMLGLTEPESGYVSLLGRKISELPLSELTVIRRACGYVPQDPYGAIPPGLSALEAVCEPDVISKAPRSRAETKARADSLLISFGLTEERIWSSRAVSLSGGQRQRVELARAMMLSPRLMLCDEPTSMQDVSTRGDIIDILKKYVKSGAGMLFVTHDLLLAVRIADRIIVLKDGCLCEECGADDVINSPAHPYTRALINAVPRINEKLLRRY